MAPKRKERRLSAILAADMVEYSRLLEADECGTIARQKRLRLEVIDPKIAQHNGRIVKTTGDGLLVEYGSIVDAVECAVAIQRDMLERERNVLADNRIQYRIGINLGDIIVDGDDILGDGVNVAARLEALADPGGIFISGKVFDEVGSKTELEFADLGEQKIKNIERSVRAYRVELQGESVKAEPPKFLDDKPAVAVLPFDNLSGDPEQEYFSDGLSEDIIMLLSAWRSFPVVARNSCFAFKGQSRDVRQIARDLAARYIIEGSVRKSGNRVRVAAQLIDAETGHHLWAEKFDGALDDIFEIQDEITRRIVSSVEPQMEEAERHKSATKRSSNLSAWDCCLRGRAFLNQLKPEDIPNARAMFEKAIELDPQYSDAYAGLSHTFLRQIFFEVAEDRAVWEQKALDAARRAVALDNNSSMAHLALSGAYIWQNQHDLSIAETRTAVELNPSNVLARLALGNRLDIVGASDEGLPLLEKSLELHPRDPHCPIYFGQLARAYITARDYDKAMSCLRESIRRKPDHPHTYHLLAVCLGHLGRIEEAHNAATRCEQLHPGFLKKRAYWNIYVAEAANQHLTEGLRKAGLVE
jgi:adenylate cyclase